METNAIGGVGQAGEIGQLVGALEESRQESLTLFLELLWR
jgi:hypothetical protein